MSIYSAISAACTLFMDSSDGEEAVSGFMSDVSLIFIRQIMPFGRLLIFSLMPTKAGMTAINSK